MTRQDFKKFTTELENFRLKGKTVKEMLPEEQPREKLMRFGAESLSDAELIAILLRTGSREMNVVETSQAMLEYFDGLRMMSRKNWQHLKIVPGIATVKAVTLEAVFELSRRIQVASLGDHIKITSPDDAVAYFAPRLRDLPREVFIVAFLNAAKMLTGFKKISSGGTTSTIVDPKDVFQAAILNDAHSILLLHNHPSGNNRESRADIRLTKRLTEAGSMLGIYVDDHIIIAGDSYTSFRDKGLI